MGARGNMLMYGDIQIASDSATLEELAIILATVLKKHKYPPQKGVTTVREEELLREALHDDTWVVPIKKSDAHGGAIQEDV